jgi:hypothetical protein
MYLGNVVGGGHDGILGASSATKALEELVDHATATGDVLLQTPAHTRAALMGMLKELGRHQKFRAKPQAQLSFSSSSAHMDAASEATVHSCIGTPVPLLHTWSSEVSTPASMDLQRPGA